MFEIGALIFPLILFFVVQVVVNKEVPLTLAVFAMTAVALYLSINPLGEFVLFILGLAAGLIVEVGLGFVVRTQHWDNASFFGVPYWLAPMWGYGFITIHRFGDLVLSWTH